MSKNDQKVTNTVSTPTNPEWVTSGTKAFADKGTDLLGQDPSKFVAGPQGINQSLFDIAGQLGPGAADALTQAGGLFGKVAGSSANLASYNPAQAQQAGAAGYNPASMAAAGYNPAMMTSAHLGPVAQASGSTAVGGINQYLNPYNDQVVNQTLSDLDRARQMTQTSNGDGAALAGQYGSSRQGVLDSQANRDFYDRAGAAVGQLRAQGFNTALGAADSDANRAQQAGLANADALNTANLTQGQLNQQGSINNQNANNQAWQFNAGNAQQANINNQNANNQAWQFNAGTAQQAGLQNAQLGQQNNQFNSTLGSNNSQFNAGQQDSVYNRMLLGGQGLSQLGQFGIGALSDVGQTQQGIAQNQAQAPLSVYGALSGDFSGLPLNLFNGRTVNGTEGVQSGDLSKIGNGLKIGSSVVQTLGSIFSDARLKRDIETVGFDAKGRRWVDYRYGWDADDAPKTRGVIAQEIAETDPDAVLMHPTGLLMVNYDMLGA